jgi:dephospho-CoA kinase
MKFENVYFITGTAYAGKSTMVKMLAEKYEGIECGENYHDTLLPGLDKAEFPCLTYTRDLVEWRDFVVRTPDEYERWVDGVSKECEILELRILEGLADKGKPVFVDTNISLDTLHKITDIRHVLVMLAEPHISVNRFFDRPDREKQFLYQLLMAEKDPEKALENFRQCLLRINSPERNERFANAGFTVIRRDESRSVVHTLALVEKAFGLV